MSVQKRATERLNNGAFQGRFCDPEVPSLQAILQWKRVLRCNPHLCNGVQIKKDKFTIVPTFSEIGASLMYMTSAGTNAGLKIHNLQRMVQRRVSAIMVVLSKSASSKSVGP